MTTDQTIPYASPADRPVGPRVWAAAAITFAGLGLLVIGGCFLIGVMLIVSGTVAPMAPGGLTNQQRMLVFLLYALGGAAFAGGIWVLAVGLRSLLRMLRN